MEKAGSTSITTILSDTLWEVHPDGSAPRLIAQNLGFPNAMDVGPDGFIYVPSWIVHKTVLTTLAFGNNPVIPFVGPPVSPTWLSFTTVVVSPTSNDLASVIYRIKR